MSGFTRISGFVCVISGVLWTLLPLLYTHFPSLFRGAAVVSVLMLLAVEGLRRYYEEWLWFGDTFPLSLGFGILTVVATWYALTGDGNIAAVFIFSAGAAIGLLLVWSGTIRIAYKLRRGSVWSWLLTILFAVAVPVDVLVALAAPVSLSLFGLLWSYVGINILDSSTPLPN